MSTIKKPLSAAGLARHLSRVLKENGFERADTSDRYHWTEGFYVRRVGCGKSVNVDYHTFDYPVEEKRALRWSKVAQMRELLFELGYDVSTYKRAIYIDCQHS